MLDTLPLAHGEQPKLARLRRGSQSQQYLVLLSPHMQLPDTYARVFSAA